MKWLPISECKRGERVLMYFPPEQRNGHIMLREMVALEVHPVGFPRKPTKFCRFPKPTSEEAIPYGSRPALKAGGGGS